MLHAQPRAWLVRAYHEDGVASFLLGENEMNTGTPWQHSTVTAVAREFYAED